MVQTTNGVPGRSRGGTFTVDSFPLVRGGFVLDPAWPDFGVTPHALQRPTSRSLPGAPRSTLARGVAAHRACVDGPGYRSVWGGQSAPRSGPGVDGGFNRTTDPVPVSNDEPAGPVQKVVPWFKEGLSKKGGSRFWEPSFTPKTDSKVLGKKSETRLQDWAFSETASSRL